MIFYQLIHCDKCNMEYKIIWDDDNHQPPTKCAGCGADEPEITNSGFMA